MLKNKLVVLIAILITTPVIHATVLPPVDSANLAIETNQSGLELRNKLTLIPQFSAQFSQQVFDAKGLLIQEAAGSVKVSQPNQFSWLTNEPDESLIVSDGSSVWVYNPFVEQVSILSLDETVMQSPLWLIANQTDAAWSQFTVSQLGDTYSIKSKDPQALTRQIDMSFKNDVLVSLKLLDSQGQSSHFMLSAFDKAPTLSADTFTFTVPDGIDIDDQRNIR